MQNIKKEPTFFLEAIPSILADTNAVLVETFAPQEDHLQSKDIEMENSVKQILTYGRNRNHIGSKWD